jgi:predicted ATP-dependent endonuclease of OLD family
MIIKEVHISNLRCIKNETIKLNELTLLVGANGVGKSSFLTALQLFYSTDDTLTEEDFFANNTTDEACISVTFTNLSSQAKLLFNKYLEGEDLTVVRVFRWNNGHVLATYHGSKLQIADFSLVRTANSAADKKTAYLAIRADTRFSGLPAWSSQSTGLEAIEAWEITHPELCERGRDDGQFFGYKSVSAGYLGRFTKFILVPAVRNAAIDGEEGKNSLFGQLIDIAIRSNTDGTTELLELTKEMKTRYEKIIDTTKTSELRKIEEDLSRELATYVIASDVKLSWDEMPTLQLPPPKAIAKVGEEGHVSSIEKKGHGLQRAFIMTLLQYLESTKKRKNAEAIQEGEEIEIPNLILGIEEPELYQHPDRQRHFFKILSNLAKINNTPSETSSTQVIYTTHSPYFVGLNHFDDIRLIRKKKNETIPEAYITSVTLDKVAIELASLVGGDQRQFTGDSLRIRLQTLMTPWMNEGFFAREVILVEGESDRAAILATATLLNKDLESMGITIIPCMGKANIDRPTLVFRNLGIPTYILWDSDKGGGEPKTELNRRLLKLVDKPEEDYPAIIDTNYACFNKDLETTLEEEITKEIFSSIVLNLQSKYEITKKDVLKNPLIMTELLVEADSKGKRSTTLISIVENILNLYPPLG